MQYNAIQCADIAVTRRSLRSLIRPPSNHHLPPRPAGIINYTTRTVLTLLYSTSVQAISSFIYRYFSIILHTYFTLWLHLLSLVSLAPNPRHGSMEHGAWSMSQHYLHDGGFTLYWAWIQSNSEANPGNARPASWPVKNSPSLMLP